MKKNTASLNSAKSKSDKSKPKEKEGYKSVEGSAKAEEGLDKMAEEEAISETVQEPPTTGKDGNKDNREDDIDMKVISLMNVLFAKLTMAYLDADPCPDGWRRKCS